MKYLVSILTVFFMIVTICSYGQVSQKKNYFPIWSYHQKNINIHGISLGIATARGEPRNTHTNGIKIELIGAGLAMPLMPISPIAENDIAYTQLLKEPISEVINGLNISASGTVCDCITNGISTGLIGQLNLQINGLSASFLMNLAQKHNGVQIALFNESFHMNGVQIGLLNEGAKTKGLQIGLFNKSKKHIGFQLGLWNVNQMRKFPLINWNFDKK